MNFPILTDEVSYFGKFKKLQFLLWELNLDCHLLEVVEGEICLSSGDMKMKSEEFGEFVFSFHEYHEFNPYAGNGGASGSQGGCGGSGGCGGGGGCNGGSGGCNSVTEQEPLND
ncbi:hypothetical protein [Pseudomonas extremaustralis]|uniref:hypothetical protein n=1 Tax=Pseudomonas extremaustralis TaxID=359110 RepID=UPI00099CF46A|nr:hypothetical protein [Pseudomonas extremaustralis]